MKREPYENIWETALGVKTKAEGYEGGRSVYFKGPVGGEIVDSEEKFGSWMTGPFSENREDVRKLFSKKAKTILDVACGAGPEYLGLQESRPDLEYTGLDITPRLVSYCQSKGINAVLGTANDMSFDDSSFDIVHTRHSLEHMKNFRDALSEFVRVARENVFVSFFIKPLGGFKKITNVTAGEELGFYNNQYDKFEIEDFLDSMVKVRSYQWIDIHEGILLKIKVSGEEEHRFVHKGKIRPTEKHDSSPIDLSSQKLSFVLKLSYELAKIGIELFPKERDFFIWDKCWEKFNKAICGGELHLPLYTWRFSNHDEMARFNEAGESRGKCSLEVMTNGIVINIFLHFAKSFRKK